MDDFEAFAADAAELFGLNEQEAANLLETMEDVFGFDESTDSLADYAVEATDVLDTVVDLDQIADDLGLPPASDEDGGEGYDEDEGDVGERVEVERDEDFYELDYEGDEWLDAGDWYELTAFYMED